MVVVYATFILYQTTSDCYSDNSVLYCNDGLAMMGWKPRSKELLKVTT